jgi:Leucine-rich repeat (LRR) protein
MNESIEQTNIQKKSSRRRYIIAAGFILLLIIVVLVFSLFQTEPKPDPASEKLIREAVAIQLNKDPNELTEEDFAKIKTFIPSGVSAFPPFQNGISYSFEIREISDIKLLEKFTNLEELSLQRIQFPEKDIPKWIKILSKIHIYDLSDKYLIDLSPLEKLPKLRHLDLSDTSFSNIKTIAALTNLQAIDLMATKVSDIKLIKSFKNLTSLRLDYTSVSDISPIKDLTKLQELYFDGIKVSNLESLKRLKNLQELSIKSCPNIIDLEPLKELIKLESLDIEDCPKITDEQVEDLQKAMPYLKIIR